MKLRKDLIEFTEAMEAELKLNDYKVSWKEQDIEFLERRLVGEVGEYFEERAKGETMPESDIGLRKEIIDVANFCMMIWDKLSEADRQERGGAK